MAPAISSAVYNGQVAPLLQSPGLIDCEKVNIAPENLPNDHTLIGTTSSAQPGAETHTPSRAKLIPVPSFLKMGKPGALNSWCVSWCTVRAQVPNLWSHTQSPPPSGIAIQRSLLYLAPYVREWHFWIIASMWGTFALECAVRIVPENLSAHLSDVNSVHPEMTSSQLRVVHFTDARAPPSPQHVRNTATRQGAPCSHQRLVKQCWAVSPMKRRKTAVSNLQKGREVGERAEMPQGGTWRDCGLVGCWGVCCEMPTGVGNGSAPARSGIHDKKGSEVQLAATENVPQTRPNPFPHSLFTRRSVKVGAGEGD